MGSIGTDMKTGTRVKHPRLGLGVIIQFCRYDGVMVNFSDKSGVLVRVVNKHDLEEVDE